MLIADSFVKVNKDGVWYVYNKYTINLEPDFVAETEEECDAFIAREYEIDNEIEEEMSKWLWG